MTSPPDLSYETQHRANYQRIAGIDEAGRGPLAGPVAAAAVILPSDFSHPLLNDSKKLTPNKRQQLYHEITSNPAIVWSVSTCDVKDITKLNILGATRLAMQQAATNINADFCLIDGLPHPNFPLPHQAIVKGDSISLSIAAASIIAKVTRDQIMREYDLLYPQYGFAQHKGYGTRQHLAAIKQYGPCPIHRLSFQPFAQPTLPLD